MTKIRSSVPFFVLNKAKLVFKKWGRGNFYSAFLWQQTASLRLIVLRILITSQETPYCVQPDNIVHSGTRSRFSSVLYLVRDVA